MRSRQEVKKPPTTDLHDRANIPTVNTVSFHKRVGRRSPSRDESPDSVCSSRSSRFSVFSDGSVANRLPSFDMEKSSRIPLERVDKNRAVKENGNLHPDALNWVNHLSPQRTRAAVPLVRTQTISNGNLRRLTDSCTRDGVSAGNCHNIQMSVTKKPPHRLVPEAVIHLYIFTFWTLTLSHEQYMRVSDGLGMFGFLFVLSEKT